MNEDLEPIEEMLRRNRVQPTSADRESIERRVGGADAAEPVRARRPRRRVAPRLAFTVAAATGALMLGSGATFALTGFSDPPSAAGVEYPTVGTQTVGGVTTPTETTPTETTPTTDEEPTVLGNDPADPAPPAAQADEQVTLPATGELPFTGLLAIPLLVAGFAFLVGGLILRGRTSSPGSG
jgi:hypothetical protein